MRVFHAQCCYSSKYFVLVDLNLREHVGLVVSCSAASNKYFPLYFSFAIRTKIIEGIQEGRKNEVAFESEEKQER